MSSKENKNKVILVMNDFLVGGVQKLAVDQMTLLNKDFDFVLVVLMQFPDRGDFYHLIPEGIKVYKLNFKSFFDLKSLFSLIKIFIKEKPRLIKTAMFFSNTIVRVLKPFFGFIVITAEHNTETQRPFLHRFLNKILSKLTYTIITDSKTVAEHVSSVEKIPKNKFTVIYNGVEISQIEKAERDFLPLREQIRSEISVKGDTPVFLTVARLVVQKNHELMISGFAEYLKRGGRGKLLIIGAGALMDNLKTLSKNLSIQDEVVFLGERQDIYKYYVASDFFLLTSIREGFCISAMNGLAFGLPLVSTRVAGVVEYLKENENGYFIDGTKESVAEQLIKITYLSEEKLNDMKLKAKQTARDFSVEAHAEKYKQLFTKCFSGR